MKSLSDKELLRGLNRSFSMVDTSPSTCMTCGGTHETRPYGDNGAEICIPCFKKTGEVGRKRMVEFLTRQEM